MDLQIDSSPNLHGSVRVPPNKSHSFRALIFAGLAEGTSRIDSPSVSNDWMLGTEALECFGAQVEPHADNVWEVIGTSGRFQTPDDVIHCGNSGIILRFFTAIAGCCDGYTVLTGDDSLRHIRPMQPLLDAMNQLGAHATSTKGDGHAPVVVRGRLGGGRAELDGADSQFVSALLIACGLGDAPTELVVHNPGEKPWVDVTLGWLEKLGIEYSNDNYSLYRVRGKSHWAGFEYRVPLDWSAAMYPIVAAVITPDSEIRVPGMDPDDTQGDKAMLDILREMGADITVEGDTVIARSSKLTGRTIDCNGVIDQLPLLAVAGAAAEGETRLVNAAVCRGKECDRIAATAHCLAAMHARIEEHDDGLTVHHSKLKGAAIDSYQDHRMIMSMAVAGLIAEGPTVIRDAEHIKKTFGHFIEQMATVGCDFRKQ